LRFSFFLVVLRLWKKKWKFIPVYALLAKAQTGTQSVRRWRSTSGGWDRRWGSMARFAGDKAGDRDNGEVWLRQLAVGATGDEEDGGAGVGAEVGRVSAGAAAGDEDCGGGGEEGKFVG
jgi:hypothetical protein